jgi:hypothetical protein
MYCIERITHLHVRNPISYNWLIFSHICSNNKGTLQNFHDFKANCRITMEFSEKLIQSQALDVQWIKCRVNVEKNIVSLLYNKEKASNAFFGTNVNKSVYLFVYGFRLTFAVFMDGDLPNSFSAASFIREQTIILH